MIILTPADAEKLVLFKEAKDILAGIQRSDYPRQEVDWLVGTAWNRGVHHAKLSRVQEASSWMQVALGLVHYSSLESKVAMMTQQHHSIAAKV